MRELLLIILPRLPSLYFRWEIPKMVSFLFLLLKPLLFLMLKKLFKKQMKVFIVSAIEWLVLQTDNDLDDKILVKVKSSMKLGIVWNGPYDFPFYRCFFDAYRSSSPNDSQWKEGIMERANKSQCKNTFYSWTCNCWHRWPLPLSKANRFRKIARRHYFQGRKINFFFPRVSCIAIGLLISILRNLFQS